MSCTGVAHSAFWRTESSKEFARWTEEGSRPLDHHLFPSGLHTSLPETPLRLHNAPGPLLPFGRSPSSEVSSSGNKSRSPSCAQVAPAAPEAQHAIPLRPLSLRAPLGSSPEATCSPLRALPLSAQHSLSVGPHGKDFRPDAVLGRGGAPSVSGVGRWGQKPSRG